MTGIEPARPTGAAPAGPRERRRTLAKRLLALALAIGAALLVPLTGGTAGV